MTETLIKIFSSLNKPLHYLVLGVVLCLWGFFSQNTTFYFLGTIIFSIPLGTFIEYLIKKYKQTKEKENLKKYYIKEYLNLNKEEKEVIDYCISNKRLTFEYCLHDQKSHVLYSLVGKRLGNNITYGGDFIINKFCYDTLIEYKKEAEDDR